MLKSKPVSVDHLGIGGALEDEGIFQSLWENLRDTFHPPKLPPLVLTSKPIPVPDRMAVKRSPATTALSVVVHVLILLLIGFLIAKHVLRIVQQKQMVAQVDLTPIAPLQPKTMGGGGSNNDKTPVTQGKLPPPVKINTPMMHPLIEQPKVPEPPSMDIKMTTPNMPNFGAINGPAVNGPGSYGMGGGTGMGNGNGSGYGNGTGGGYGGGVFQVGGGVSEPIPIHLAEAEFSDEARRAKFQGVVYVTFIVDATGHVKDPHVMRDPGLGLAEKALEAVRTWTFKPAMKAGKPVAVYESGEVSFTIY